MTRRGMFVGMLASALVLLVPKAWAQRPPPMGPPSGVVSQDVVMAWDRSAIPADIEVWPQKTLIAHDHLDPSKLYGALFLTCASASDSATGRCPVEDTHSTATRVLSAVPTSFVEQRSGLRSDIDISVGVQRVDHTGACSAGYWADIQTSSSSAGIICFGSPPVGTGGVLLISQQNLRRLTAGHWKGTLELRLRRPPAEHLATYTFNFDFTVTDYDAVSIYFPEFPQTAPHINLDLRYSPLGPGTILGRKPLDMCLYDGVGSQSEYLGITVRDVGPRPVGDEFSIWHADSTGDASERVPFNVLLEYAGTTRRLRSGVEEQLRGIDSTALRLVKLPGIDQPVYCVPAPLTFETPTFVASSKRQGVYEGEVKVELRVPTVRP